MVVCCSIEHVVVHNKQILICYLHFDNISDCLFGTLAFLQFLNVCIAA